jgi:hypothetical protein
MKCSKWPPETVKQSHNQRFEIQTVYSSTLNNRADAAFVFSLDLGLSLCKYFQFFLVS